MRVYRVKSARATDKPRNCIKCGNKIEKGEPYSYCEPRFGPRKCVCGVRQCRLRQSDLTSNDKMSELYSVQEGLEDAINGWDEDDASVLVEALREAAEGARAVAEQYNDSADSIEEYFISGNEQSEQARENADSIEEWADELESAADEIESEAEDIPDIEELEAAFEAAEDAANDAPEDITEEERDALIQAVEEAEQELEEARNDRENKMADLRSKAEDALSGLSL